MDLAEIIVYVTLGALAYLILTTIRSIFWPDKPRTMEYQPPMIGDITIPELAKYNGMDPFRPILFSVKGQVYDVTLSRDFYGPGMPAI